VLEYEGDADGIFNFSNKTLVLYEKAASCMNSIPEGQYSFHQDWRSMKEDFVTAGYDPTDFWSRATHR
jgi:hypothetical protein